MTPLFPEVSTDAEFDAVRRDEQALGAGLRAICGRLRLAGERVVRFSEGTQPVYAIGDARVLKIYPPFLRSHGATESVVLEALEGRLPIPTPAMLDVGELEGWTYLLMQRLPGESLAVAWPRISPEQRLGLARRLGESLATLHATRVPGLAPGGVDWAHFLADQRRTCVERQRQHGLSPLWLEQIPEFLDGISLEPVSTEALLHTEVMREHLLVSERFGRWNLSGLFDFEPAMHGAPEYEFGAVGLFFSSGEASVLREVLTAYGYASTELDASLGRRLLAYKLLHRYSNLRWYLERMPPSAHERTLDSLAQKWWGLAEAPLHSGRGER